MRSWKLRTIPAVLVALSLAALVGPRRGVTIPLYATRTGLMCQTCHFDPNGGGPRNDFGFAFAKNRHSITPDTTGEWKDLALRNRVGDDFPLYFGLNQRFMLLANQQQKTSGVDRVGFWNMENSIDFTFQPHPKLTLVYNLEQTYGSTYQAAEAFGMIGLPADLYIRAGQFRVPFGLRMDDHTVATRNSFLDFQTGQSFLPYDPRFTDRGVELGGAHGNWFGRASFTNGSSTFGNNPPDLDQHPQAVAAKLGMNSPHYQGAVSVYDDFSKGPSGSNRYDRWGYYALTHAGPFAFLGEIAAGTDAQQVGAITARTNKLAGFAELNWAPQHVYNMRARYDRLELDRATDALERALNTYNRFSLEGEWVPVPFAELRWSARLIQPKKKAGGVAIDPAPKDEKQYFLQLHLSY